MSSMSPWNIIERIRKLISIDIQPIWANVLKRKQEIDIHLLIKPPQIYSQKQWFFAIWEAAVLVLVFFRLACFFMCCIEISETAILFWTSTYSITCAHWPITLTRLFWIHWQSPSLLIMSYHAQETYISFRLKQVM